MADRDLLLIRQGSPEADARAHVQAMAALFDVVVTYEDGTSALDVDGPLVTDLFPYACDTPRE